MCRSTVPPHCKCMQAAGLSVPTDSFRTNYPDLSTAHCGACCKGKYICAYKAYFLHLGACQFVVGRHLHLGACQYVVGRHHCLLFMCFQKQSVLQDTCLITYTHACIYQICLSVCVLLCRSVSLSVRVSACVSFCLCLLPEWFYVCRCSNAEVIMYHSPLSVLDCDTFVKLCITMLRQEAAWQTASPQHCPCFTTWSTPGCQPQLYHLHTGHIMPCNTAHRRCAGTSGASAAVARGVA